MYSELSTSFGIVFVTGHEFIIYKLTKTGNNFEPCLLFSKKVDLPNRHDRGGQSALRFARLADERENTYIKLISETVIKYFTKNNNTEIIINKLVLVGPGKKKLLVQQNNLINTYFKNNIIMMDAGDINNQTIYETLGRCEHFFNNEEHEYYMNIINTLKNKMELIDDKLLFGLDEINLELDNMSIKEIYTFIDIDIPKEKLGKCKVTKIPNIYFTEIGINIIALKWY